MTKRVQAVLILVGALATMFLTGCGTYNCNTDDGLSFNGGACTSGSPSGASSGSTGSSTGNPGATAFAFHIDQAGSIDGYTLNQTAGGFGTTPNYVAPVIPANLGGAGMVVAQGKYLYAAFDDLSQIYGWSIDGTGNLTTLSGMPLSVTLVQPQVSYNQYVMITNPAGTLLFISEAALSQILVYQISSSGSLTPAPGSPYTTTGIEPQNMGMDGLGKYLYVSEDSGDHAGSIVAGYTVSSAGVLQPIAGSPFNYPLWEMQGDPSGSFLFGISGEISGIFGTNDNHIYAFNIGTTGAITPVTNSPLATTYAPFTMAVQPASSGQAFVYTFSQNDLYDLSPNPTEAFQMNSSGALTEISGSPFLSINSPSWGQFDPSGNYLFFYLYISNNSGLTSFQVSNTGALTLGPDVTLSTNGYWAVSDVP